MKFMFVEGLKEDFKRGKEFVKNHKKQFIIGGLGALGIGVAVATKHNSCDVEFEENYESPLLEAPSSDDVVELVQEGEEEN